MCGVCRPEGGWALVTPPTTPTLAGGGGAATPDWPGRRLACDEGLASMCSGAPPLIRACSVTPACVPWTGASRFGQLQARRERASFHQYPPWHYDMMTCMSPAPVNPINLPSWHAVHALVAGCKGSKQGVSAASPPRRLRTLLPEPKPLLSARVISGDLVCLL